MAYQPDPEITYFAEKALAGRLEEFQGLLQEFTELISKRLAVMCRQVVESADGRGSDSGVLPVVIVEVQPAG